MHGSSVGSPPPALEPPVVTDVEPPVPGELPPLLLDVPALAGGFVMLPPVPTLEEPPLDELPPLPVVPPLPVLSAELPPQAVAALKPNTKIPNRCFIDSPRVCDLKTTFMVALGSPCCVALALRQRRP